ncbi:MAG: DUF5664 domain-containing protein [Candidatus Woesearchaeota archaeon]|jgi:hypothetical protein|nr:DUF5664 domain-containing protein [Candidatus Woesearchaeota archaeon]
MKKLKNYKSLDTCPYCSSPQKDYSNSLHAWEIVYHCGCELTGAIGNSDVLISYKCQSKSKKKISELEIIKALRYNKGKLNWGLVHFKSMKPLVKVLMFGANKYEAFNWMKDMPLKDIEESAFRHLTAIMDGETHDLESGELHIGHLMCNAMFWNYHYNKQQNE